MSFVQRNRKTLLRVIYASTALIATVVGLLMLLAPAEIVPDLHDDWNRGIFACMELTFGLLAAVGLVFPYRFIPLLLFQMVYKTIWLAVMVLPMVFDGSLTTEQIAEASLYVVFIVGDAIVIPFGSLFDRATRGEHV